MKHESRTNVVDFRVGPIPPPGRRLADLPETAPRGQVTPRNLDPADGLRFQSDE